MTKRVQICIKFKEAVYEIVSIYLLSDGSFKIDIPNLTFNKGVLLKIPVDFSLREQKIPNSVITEKFSASNRPQLVIHKSGFVQFSGKGIRSGITETGKIKGIGTYINSLDDPITTGPTCSVSFWGVPGLNVRCERKSTDIIFEESHFISRFFKGTSQEKTLDQLNTCSFEFFIFPKSSSVFITKNEMMTCKFINYIESPGAIFTFPIIRLRNHDSFVGVVPFRIYTDHPKKINSGFVIGGPSGRDLPDSTGNTGVIKAFSSEKLVPICIDRNVDF